MTAPRRESSPLFVVLSGPSGVGKDAVLRRLRELGRPYHFTVTATTRPPRPNEQDGVDYTFLSQEAFDELVRGGGLLEWAQVYRNRYGVPRLQVKQALARGEHVLVRTDIQGAETIRAQVPQGVFVFLAPPSVAELERRLRERTTNNRANLRLRLRAARQEMAAASRFDYVIVNREGRLDESVAALEAIIAAESHRAQPRRVSL